MTEFKNKVESILKDLAVAYTPPGSEIKATIHQWIHALNSGSKLFAENRGADRKVIVKALDHGSFLTPTGNFKKKYYLNLN